MTISVQCSSCGKQFRLRDERAGTQFSCNECGELIAIPNSVRKPVPRSPPQPAATPKPRSAAAKTRRRPRKLRPSNDIPFDQLDGDLESPYRPLPAPKQKRKTDSKRPRNAQKPAGFGRRAAAFFLDALPINVAVFLIFYLFLGFDEVLHEYIRTPSNTTSHATFLTQRNLIRDITFFLTILYCSIAESSSLQGTFGKRLLGIRVIDSAGRRLTFGRSLGRNCAKILSRIPWGLGYLWAIWSRRKRCWHDMIAQTEVVRD